MNWTEFDLDMPQGIVVMKGENKKIPLKAWVAKIKQKTVIKRTPTGPPNKCQKSSCLKPTLVPKWTPEASGNVCGRRSATERAKHASCRPPGR